MRHRPRHVRHLVLAVVAGLALVSGPGATASEAEPPPSLTSITYLHGPFARVGWASIPVARVELSGPAPADTSVNMMSSDPGVATVDSIVVVPNGMTGALVLVNGISEGTTTLSAQLGASPVLNATPPLQVAGVTRVPELQSLSVEPASVTVGGSATGLVTLDFLAPAGGTQLQLTSSPPDVGIDATVTVTEDDYQASFSVQAPDQPGSFTISATLGAVTKTAPFVVVEPPPTPPPGAHPPVVDTTAPDTGITASKVRRAKQKVAFSFASTEAGSTFECRLDGKAFAPCTSPWTSRRLKPGHHVFFVQARDAAGNIDASPAHTAFKIKRKR